MWKYSRWNRAMFENKFTKRNKRAVFTVIFKFDYRVYYSFENIIDGALWCCESTSMQTYVHIYIFLLLINHIPDVEKVLLFIFLFLLKYPSVSFDWICFTLICVHPDLRRGKRCLFNPHISHTMNQTLFFFKISALGRRVGGREAGGVGGFNMKSYH